jgi:hypothetical protein
MHDAVPVVVYGRACHLDARGCNAGQMHLFAWIPVSVTRYTCARQRERPGRLCPPFRENLRIAGQPDESPGSAANCRADLAAHHPADDCRSEDDSGRHRTSPQEVSGGRASSARRRTDAADADLAAVWAATTASFGESAATGRRAGRSRSRFHVRLQRGLRSYRVECKAGPEGETIIALVLLPTDAPGVRNTRPDRRWR